jgi:beta-glucosidase
MLQFPQGFVWGAAASSYQIEGAVTEDGRGESIWDRFAHTPGKTFNGNTGDVACDHYHRFADDVQLMAELGLRAYRFSISWPRILPDGKGPINECGLAFYDRLVDTLCQAGIDPHVVLYHWDLPQALDDGGGWLNRDIADRFAHYADVVSRRLGDRVTHWATFNEPLCIALLGYFTGEQAPGHQDQTFAEANTALHHVYLAHGKAVPVLRANSSASKIGIMLNIYPVYPATDSEEDRAAALRFERFHTGWFAEPVLKGEYPAEVFPMFGPSAPKIQPGDMALISAPLDFVGLNYYSRMVVADDPAAPDPLKTKIVHVESSEYTDMDWEIYPDGLHDLLVAIDREYHLKEIYIAENGCAMPDVLDANGQVHDPRRVAYLQAHLLVLQQTMAQGIPVKGYFVWSLLDNFEWAFGYSKRFGIVYVDYATQRRIPKSSYHFYQDVLRANGVPEA